MKNTPWFYNPLTNGGDLAKTYRIAYEKSLKDSRHAVKAQSGTYFYRGYEISNDGGREFPWSYNRPEDSDFCKEFAETKKLAMAYIDDILKEEPDLCDLICG